MSGPTSEPALKQIAPQRFTAPIYRVGANCCVDAPPRVSRAFGTGRYVAVVGTANGFEFRTTLVPRGGGLHRLFLNGDVRAAAGVGEGDSVTVRLAFDAEPREVPVAEDVSVALRALPGASDVFRGFTRRQRTSMLEFIESAKGAETRSRRVERMIEHVRQRLGG